MGIALAAVLVGFVGVSQVDYKQQIVNAANRYGVPPEIALAVAQRESGFSQYDSAGNVLARYEPHLGESSLGIFQLLESTARELGVDPRNPSQNIEGGVRYLSQMYRATGDWQQALAAYNGGIGNWQRGTVSSAARSYASAVMSSALQITATPAGALPTQQQVQATMSPWNPFEGFEWPTLTFGGPQPEPGIAPSTLAVDAGGAMGGAGMTALLAVGALALVYSLTS